MRSRAVLEIEGERSPGTDRPFCPTETAAAPGDHVRLLLQVVQRPDGSLHPSLVGRAKPPFDAQYWACWAFAFLYPVFMVYLWLTR